MIIVDYWSQRNSFALASQVVPSAAYNSLGIEYKGLLLRVRQQGSMRCDF